MPDDMIDGGCHCGAVRYRLTARPTYSMVCHCRTCQRVGGAPVVAWVTFPRAAFSLIRGAPRSYRSSPGVERLFCGACGTQIAYSTARDADWIDLTTASLDDPSACPPSHHSWLNHDIAWVKFGDGLPSFPQSRPAVAPPPEET